MKKLIALTLVLATSPALAQSSKSRALASAEQSALLAECKVDWLKSGGTGARSAEFYRFMAGCLSKSAAN